MLLHPSVETFWIVSGERQRARSFFGDGVPGAPGIAPQKALSPKNRHPAFPESPGHRNDRAPRPSVPGGFLFPGAERAQQSPGMPGDRLEDALRALLRDAPPQALCAWLFGSEARGEAGRRSDVDVAVLYVAPPEPRLDAGPLDLEGALERALGRPVQLVVNRAPADLVHRVLRDGRLLLDRDRAARIRFEVARRNEYFDLAPLRVRYRAGSRRAS